MCKRVRRVADSPNTLFPDVRMDVGTGTCGELAASKPRFVIARAPAARAGARVCDRDRDGDRLARDVDFVNGVLARVLCANKDLIDEHCRNGKWDNAKTFTNPYELVYKTDAIAFSPVSRAFFKMWEMMVDYCIGGDAPLSVGYIAEGPGGFIQAVVEYRKKRTGGVGDRHTAITLVSKKRSVPCWKISRDWAERNNVEFYYGEDGSGDIYNVANVRGFSARCSGYDVITADGGFDFSGDFNSQEKNVLGMLAAEVLCALASLREGGVFVFKAFDTLTRATACIVQVLVDCFEEVSCVKPLSSRPANSEKYFLCRGYDRAAGFSRVGILERVVRGECEGRGGTAECITELVRLDDSVYYNLCLVNIALVARQMLTISKTLAFIQTGKRDLTRHDQEVLAGVWTDRYM